MSSKPEFMEGVFTGTTLSDRPSGNPLPRGVDGNDHFFETHECSCQKSAMVKFFSE